MLFWAIILFQLTELIYIWDFSFISRPVNFLLLFIFFLMGLYSIRFQSFSFNSFMLFLFPSLLIFVGLILNITLNVIRDTNLVGYYWLLLPWLAILCIPLLRKTGFLDPVLLWDHLYYFLLISVSISLIEYLFVFNGAYTLRIADFPGGTFLVGKFTMFHVLEDASPHERFYGSFGEPGTLAMYLLPTIGYALFKKRYYSLIVFLPAFYFTYSLGGAISLVLMILSLPIILFKSSFSKFFFAISILIFLVVSGKKIYQNFEDKYENRGNSANTREENLFKTLALLPVAIVNYPLGLNLDLSTNKSEKNKWYFGSNFTPGYAFITGGLLSLIGYCWILIVSIGISIKILFFSKQAKFLKVIGIFVLVLFPFIFQRMTIWESPLFALMYLPFLLQAIEKKQNTKI